MHFQVCISYTFGVMLRTKIKCYHISGEITQKLQKHDLWSLRTALPLDDIYPPVKFEDCISNTFGDMLRTKIKCIIFQGEITQKIRKQELWP